MDGEDSPRRSPNGDERRNGRNRHAKDDRSKTWRDTKRRRSRSPEDYYYRKRPRVNHHGYEPYPGRPLSPGDRFGRLDMGPSRFDPHPASPYPLSDGVPPLSPYDRVSPYSRSYAEPPFDLMYNRIPFERSPVDRRRFDRSMECPPFDHPGRERLGFDPPPFIHPSLDIDPLDGHARAHSHRTSQSQLRDVSSAGCRNSVDVAKRKYSQSEPHIHMACSSNFDEGNRNSEADFSDDLSLLRADGMDVENGNCFHGRVDLGRSINMSPQQRPKGNLYTSTPHTNSGGGWSTPTMPSVARGRSFSTRANSASGRGFGRGSRGVRGGRGATAALGSSTVRGRSRGSVNNVSASHGTVAHAAGGLHTNNRGKAASRAKARPASGQFLPTHKVHSMANIKQPDAANMSLAEKLHRFGLFLRNESLKENSIQTVENALTACKLNLRSHYEACELLKYAGRPMFTGCLYVGGQFIIRAVGATKKELKHDVYSQALSIFTTNSVVDILGKRDQGLGVIREELMESLKASNPQESPSVVTKDAEEHNTEDGQSAVLKAAFAPLVQLMTTKPVIADNKISVLEQSISMSHCTYKTEFTCEEGKLVNGKRTFRVLLKLGETLISEGRGMKKKDAKHAAYANAVTALTTRTLDDLIKGENVEGSSADQWCQLEASDSEPSSHKAMRKTIKDVQLNLSEGFNLEKQFTKLVDGLKDSSFKINNVNSIDCLAVQLALSPVCFYRKVDIVEDISTLIACDLYINNIFLGTGESNTKKDAQIEAYHKAWDLLTTTSPTILLTQQPRKVASDPPDPSVFDKVVKGSGKYGDSNLERLNRLKIDVYENWKSLKDLIIMEHTDWVGDRERHAFCILNQSATFSGLLMEWAFTGMQGGIYECSINLQNEQVGYGKSSTKQGARSMASQVAMSRFYKTQPIVQILRRDDSKLWLPWEDFKEQAEKWTPPPGFMEGVSLQNSSSGSADGTVTLNEKVVKYGTHLIEKQMTMDNLEDVIFGPGLPGPESRAITHQALRLRMKVDTSQHMTKSYLIISRKMTPDVLVECLQRNSGVSGKYLLLSEQDRPTLVVVGTPSKTATSVSDEVLSKEGQKPDSQQEITT